MKSFSSWLWFCALLVLAIGCDSSPSSKGAGTLGTARSAGAASCPTPGMSPVSVSLSAYVEGSVPYGQPITFATYIYFEGPTPTGTVTFTSPAGLSCTAPVMGLSESQAVVGSGPGYAQITVPSSGASACSFLFPASGTPHVVTATYSGDDTYVCGQSDTASVTVSPADVGVDLYSDAASRTCNGEDNSGCPVYGEPVTFGLSVYRLDEQTDPDENPYYPPGSGVLSVNAGPGTSKPLVDGTTSFTLSDLPVGTNDVGGDYAPSTTNYSAGKGAFVTQRVVQASSSISNVTAAPDPSIVGQAVSLSATVSPVSPSTATPDGTVRFMLRGLRGLQGFPGGAAPEGLVQIGDLELCSATIGAGGAASCSTSTLPAGVHYIYARYDGSVRFSGSMSASDEEQTVRASVGFSVALTSSATGSGDPVAYSSTYGTGVTFTATILTEGGGDPTGSVDFYDLSSATPNTPFATVTLSTTGGVTSATTAAVNWLRGAHDVRAVYAGDATHQNPGVCPAGGMPCPNVPGQDTRTLTIAPHGTQISLAVSSTAGATSPSAKYGQPITFTSVVTPSASPAMAAGSAVPNGVVRFLAGATSLGTAPVSTTAGPDLGKAVFVHSLLDVATHSITAVFEPTSPATANFTGQTSSAQSLTIDKAATQTALTTSAPATLTVGTSVTFTAAITVSAPGAVGATTPTGPSASQLADAPATVTFKDGANVLGTGVLDGTLSTPVRRAWRFTTTSLAVGTHNVTAEFAGNARFLASVSSAVTHIVNQDGIAPAFSSSQNPSAFGVDVIYTATLTSTTGGPPTGTLTFSEGGTPIGTATLTAGSANLTHVKPSVGIHTIDVSYSGDANHTGGPLGSFTQTVNRAATTTTLASSATSSVVGQTVRFTATITSPAPGTPGGTVTFRDGATALGTALVGAGGVATFDAPSLGVGTHAISAAYGGDASFAPSSSSTSVTQSVSKAASSVTLESSTNPSLLGTSVTFTATVTAVAPATGSPSGIVRFLKGGIPVGNVALSAAGTATFTTDALVLGPNAFSVTYDGDAAFLGGTASLTQTTSADAATIVVTASPATSAFGDTVVLKATLTGSAGVPSGSIIFRIGPISIGGAGLDASGVATFTTASLPVGTVTVTAVYSGSPTYAAGTGTTAHEVSKAPTTTAVTASANPATVGDPITFTAQVSSTGGPVTGEVEVKNGALSLGIVALTGGSATYTTSAIPAGTHVITIAYKGSDDFLTSETTLTLVVDPPAPPPSSSSSSSSGSPPSSTPPPSTVDPGNLNLNPGAGGQGGDDCAMAPGPSGGAGWLLGLVAAVLMVARRRRR